MSSTDPFIGLAYNWNPTSENFAAGMDTNLKTIGALLHLAVEDKDVSDPSTLTPSNGEAWIVAATAVGAWVGQENSIAAYVDSAWLFLTPKEGWKTWIKDEASTALFNGTSWTNNPNGGGSINDGSNLGAGTGIHAGISSDELTFKSLVAGSGIGISSDANEITLTSSAGAALSELNSQTGTTYTPVLGDAGKVVEMNNASSNTLTVPPNSSVAFSIGTTLVVRQMGTGQTTIAEGSGVTIRNPHGTLNISAQYGWITLHKRDTDEWCIEGNLAEA